MTISYDKWNHLDDYESSDDSSADEAPVASPSSGKPPVAPLTKNQKTQLGDLIERDRATFVTDQWDPKCEKVRWALDLHGSHYVEHAWPWGLHIWNTLPFSEDMPKRQITQTPVLESDQKEVFRRNTTDILLWLYSRSLCSPIRIYAKPAALDLENYFDEHLADAAQVIFYSAVIHQPDLVRRYLVEPIHLDTTRTIFRLAWPLLSVILRYHFDILLPWRENKTVARAWDAVDEVFARVESALTSSPDVTGDWYICGETFTAADLTFAAYAEFILFPNSEETLSASANVPLEFPPASRLPPDHRRRVTDLRKTVAGRFALRMYKKHRCRTRAIFPSRYAKTSMPWWSQDENLFWTIILSFATYLAVLGLALLAMHPFTVFLFHVLGSIAFVGWFVTAETPRRVRTIARQLVFVTFGKAEVPPPQK